MNDLVQLVYGDCFLFPTCLSSKLTFYCIPLAWNAFGNPTCFWVSSFLVHPSRIFPPYWMMVLFNDFDWLVFIRIVFYDSYHVIPNPPMKFQAHAVCFGWVLDVVTLRLPLLFHLGISYSKPHGLT